MSIKNVRFMYCSIPIVALCPVVTVLGSVLEVATILME